MVTWRGVRLDSRTAAMMDEVARLCPGIPIMPSQGSYSTGVAASGGTHNGGGAIDIRAVSLSPNQRATVVAAMRRVGFAAWLRTPSQSNWPYHLHGIAIGCPDLSPGAASQVRDYLAGRNGLASHAPDDGPRQYANATWEKYQAAGQPATGNDDWSNMKVITFFQNKGTVYEANLVAGTYRPIANPQDLGDRKTVLTKAGIEWFEWSPGKDVANLEAFGTRT